MRLLEALDYKPIPSFPTTHTHTHPMQDICFPLVEGVLNGYNGTVFAYGQTGCGKSYTMMGVDDPPANRGIIPRAFDHIFDHVAVSEGTRYLLTASYLEIYNEEVRDLLGRDVKKRLELHEHPEKGVYVQDLSSHKVTRLLRVSLAGFSCGILSMVCCTVKHYMAGML